MFPTTQVLGACTQDHSVCVGNRRLKTDKVHLSVQAVRMGAESHLEQAQYSRPIPGRNRFSHMWWKNPFSCCCVHWLTTCVCICVCVRVCACAYTCVKPISAASKSGVQVSMKPSDTPHPLLIINFTRVNDLSVSGGVIPKYPHTHTHLCYRPLACTHTHSPMLPPTRMHTHTLTHLHTHSHTHMHTLVLWWGPYTQFYMWNLSI